MAATKHKKGDRVTVLDYHTPGPSPYMRDYHVTAVVDGYYHLMPAWTSDPHEQKRLPMSYPHTRDANK